MSLFNPEYKFVCKKCGNTWYLSAKDIKEGKKNAAMVKQLNAKQMGAIFAGSKRKIEAQKAMLQSNSVSYDKCPVCGSHSIEKKKD